VEEEEEDLGKVEAARTSNRPPLYCLRMAGGRYGFFGGTWEFSDTEGKQQTGEPLGLVVVRLGP